MWFIQVRLSWCGYLRCALACVGFCWISITFYAYGRSQGLSVVRIQNLLLVCSSKIINRAKGITIRAIGRRVTIPRCKQLLSWVSLPESKQKTHWRVVSWCLALPTVQSCWLTRVHRVLDYQNGRMLTQSSSRRTLITRFALENSELGFGDALFVDFDCHCRRISSSSDMERAETKTRCFLYVFLKYDCAVTLDYCRTS